MKPLAVVVAGPSGSGKSTYFPVREFGVGSFNVDDRCAELNRGSYRGIPDHLRRQAQRECETFVADSIAKQRSFAVETTLRSLAAIEQAERARSSGFHTCMIFVASDDVEENIRRVTRRALDGGHGAPFARIREIYRSSLANLSKALPVFHEAFLYDSSAHAADPRIVRRYEHGQIIVDLPPAPVWLAAVP
jgi:predicted ABC-type ATPase